LKVKELLSICSLILRGMSLKGWRNPKCHPSIHKRLDNLTPIRRCGDEIKILREHLEDPAKQKTLVVILTSRFWAADVIVLSWDVEKKKPLLISVQVRTSPEVQLNTDSPRPKRLLTLEQPFAKNREEEGRSKPSKQSTEQTAKMTEKEEQIKLWQDELAALLLFLKHGCVQALLLLQPMAVAAVHPFELQENSKLLVVVDKRSWSSLFPGLRRGIANLLKFKRSQYVP